jgi:hypothetical protein
MGTQCLNHDWSRHEYGPVHAVSGADEQARPERRHSTRRRVPLRLDGRREY